MKKSAYIISLFIVCSSYKVNAEVIYLKNGGVITGKIDLNINETELSITNDTKIVIKIDEIEKVEVFDEAITNFCLRLKELENCNLNLLYVDDRKNFYLFDIDKKSYLKIKISNMDSFTYNFEKENPTNNILLPEKTVAKIFFKNKEEYFGEIKFLNKDTLEYQLNDITRKVKISEIEKLEYSKSNSKLTNQMIDNQKVKYYDYLLPGVYQWRNDHQVLGSFLGIFAIYTFTNVISSYTKGNQALQEQDSLNNLGIISQQYYLVDPSYKEYYKQKRINTFSILTLGLVYTVNYLNIIYFKEFDESELFNFSLDFSRNEFNNKNEYYSEVNFSLKF